TDADRELLAAKGSVPIAAATGGALKPPHFITSSSSSDKKSNLRSSSLSFSSSLCENISVQRRRIGGSRAPLVVCPKSVSDSKNSQTCLDPDASQVIQVRFCVDLKNEQNETSYEGSRHVCEFLESETDFGQTTNGALLPPIRRLCTDIFSQSDEENDNDEERRLLFLSEEDEEVMKCGGFNAPPVAAAAIDNDDDDHTGGECECVCF
nr:glucose-1-phosphate adenylyltransferase small subunit, chloroplastic/amyloplastic [Tanacetum cinerariifolium]